MKKLETLIPDIAKLFETGHQISEANLKSFADNIAQLVKGRIEEANKVRPPGLRMSKIGTPNRKLWYEFHTDQEPKKLEYSTHIKFLYGDIIEQLALLLAKEAGHLVEDEQGEVEIDGVIGHKDATIDGIPVDIKSASKFGFAKFEKGTLFQDDSFGYVPQLSSYAYADGKKEAAFWAINKEGGEMTILKLDEIDMIDPPTRIREVREVIELKEPPLQKCYEPKPHGKSGNIELPKNCSYCPFKDKCWSDANNGKGIRRFKYSNGITELIEVVETPRVDEITK